MSTVFYDWDCDLSLSSVLPVTDLLCGMEIGKVSHVFLLLDLVIKDMIITRYGINGP